MFFLKWYGAFCQFNIWINTLLWLYYDRQFIFQYYNCYKKAAHCLFFVSFIYSLWATGLTNSALIDWLSWVVAVRPLLPADFTLLLLCCACRCSTAHLPPHVGGVKFVLCGDCYEGHGMLILLPSDVQGLGNALIISSRVPLKEKPSGGGWRAAGWGV